MVQKIDAKPPVTIIQPQQTPVVIQEQVIFHQPSTIKIEHQLPTDLVTSQPQTSHMTLNRLNAQEEEEEMDESSFQSEVKIEAGFSEVSWSSANDSDNNEDDGDEFLGTDDHGDFWNLDIKISLNRQ